MDTRGVIVDNGLVRHVIPWSDLSEIGVRQGLYFRLRDRREIGSITFAGSLGGLLTGFWYTKRVAARMQEAREALTSRAAAPAVAPGYSRRVSVLPWPPLVILAILEGIAALPHVLR